MRQQRPSRLIVSSSSSESDSENEVEIALFTPRVNSVQEDDVDVSVSVDVDEDGNTYTMYTTLPRDKQQRRNTPLIVPARPKPPPPTTTPVGVPSSVPSTTGAEHLDLEEMPSLMTLDAKFSDLLVVNSLETATFKSSMSIAVTGDSKLPPLHHHSPHHYPMIDDSGSAASRTTQQQRAGKKSMSESVGQAEAQASRHRKYRETEIEHFIDESLRRMHDAEKSEAENADAEKNEEDAEEK